MPRSDTFPRESVSTAKDPTRVPVPIANQPRGNDQGDTEHFVRRFAVRRSFLSRLARRPTQRGWRQPRRAGSSPYSHSIINSFAKSLSGLMLISQRRVFYRQKYRHFEWHPRAQLPSSIDIYRKPSALPQSLAFEIYRGQSLCCMRSRRWKQPLGHSSRERQGSGIRWHNLLSHRVFVADFLPSRRRRTSSAISAHPPSAPLLPSTA